MAKSLISRLRSVATAKVARREIRPQHDSLIPAVPISVHADRGFYIPCIERDVDTGGITMPKWLRNQLMRAFYGKDRKQIRFLNACWFTYREKEQGALPPRRQ